MPNILSEFISKVPLESAKQDGLLLPNLISYLRLLLLPIPVWLLVAGFDSVEQRWAAMVWFAALALSDAVDGFVARTFNMRSEWGRFLDPIADKMFVVALLVPLCIMYAGHPLWMILVLSTAFMIIRELVLFVQIGRANDTIQEPTFSGKAKTVFQMAMIAAWTGPFLMIESLSGIVAFATCIALLATFISWVDYYRLYVAKTHK